MESWFNVFGLEHLAFRSQHLQQTDRAAASGSRVGMILVTFMVQHFEN